MFQAVRGLFKGHRDELWAEVGRRAAADIQREFAGELAAVTLDVLDRAIGSEPAVVEVCGETGRVILAWALRARREPNDGFVDNIGSIYGVPLVSRTFATDVVGSRRLVARVLDGIANADLPISYLSQLTRELSHIWPIDSDVAVDVYVRTFTHEERSDEVTQVGTPILPMTSTRRQDFSMCQYHLAEHFPSFLEDSFVSAARAAVRSLNGFVVQSHVAPYLGPARSLADVTEKFAFRGRSATYIRDFSYVWEAGVGGGDYAVSLGDRLLRRVEDVAQGGSDGPMESFLDLLAEEAQVAFWWKRVLELGGRLSSFFASRLFPLVVAPSVLRNSETFHAASVFIERAARHFSEGQRRELESVILRFVDDDPDAPSDRRDRLLSCLPAELLSTAEARRLRAEMEGRESAAKKEPLVHIESRWNGYSEDHWLRDGGANPDDPENRAVLHATKPADEFSSRWRNERPTRESVREFLPRLEAGLGALRGTVAADGAVVEMAWTRLAEGAVAVASGLSAADDEGFVLTREIFLGCLQAEPPVAENTDSDEAYTFASWSPSPATAASQGLPWLARLVGDADVLDACASLAADQRPAVRFLAAQGCFRFLDTAPGVFWRIIDERAAAERSPAVQEALCRTIGYALARDRERAVAALSVMADRLLVPGCESSAVKALTSIALSLVLGDRPDDWGRSVANRLLGNPAEFAYGLGHAVSEVANSLDPAEVGGVHDLSLSRRIDWLDRAVAASVAGLREYLPSGGPLDEDSTKVVKTLYGVLHEVVMRVYFCFKGGHGDAARGNGTETQRAQFYSRVKPVLERIVHFANEPRHGLLFAPTAHHFMEFLGEALEYDPRGALRLAAAVAIASSRADYCLDGMAAGEAVRLAERIVADYRGELRDPEALSDLVTLLDLFAKVGWPGALRLLWKLDEVFR